MGALEASLADEEEADEDEEAEDLEAVAREGMEGTLVVCVIPAPTDLAWRLAFSSAYRCL